MTLARTSLSVKNSRFDPNDIEFTWEFSTYTNAISDYSEQFLRSFAYAGAATVLCIAIGYPMAYVIAFEAAGTATCCSGWWWSRSSPRS